MKTLLLVNARFVDGASARNPVGEAMLVREGRIVAVGDLAAVSAQAGAEARRIDLGGCVAMPGFVDSHVHLLGFGEAMSQCDLAGTASREEAVRRVGEYAKAHPAAGWIRGGGYNLNAWANPAYPTALELDRAVGDRPCLLSSFDGHSVWGNTAALRAAGITAGTADPAGGRILRDEQGRAAGCLLENAVGLLYAAAPALSEAEVDAALRMAIEEMCRRGHTAVHVPLLTGERKAGELIGRLERLYPGNSCPLRIRFFSPFSDLEEVAGLVAEGGPERRVRAVGIKCFADGSLGSRTAWLSEPFLDAAGSCGMAVMDGAELREQIRATNGRGLPLICHAIGDRACGEVLRAFVDAGKKGMGNRVEHAQILRPEDVRLFVEAGVAASVQPGHIFTDWEPSDRLLGAERSGWCYAFRRLVEVGVVVAVGSDAPVVPPALGASLHAWVTRTDAEGKPAGGWHAEQKLTAREWAVAASADAWRSIGERRGRLAPGCDCDLTLLGEDPLSAQMRDYRALAVLGTVVGGEVVSETRNSLGLKERR